MRSKLRLTILVGTLLVAGLVRGASPPPTVKSIGDKVMCLCGCVAILNQCPHHGCSTHEEVQAVIQKLISEGKDEPEILQALTARYGTQILAAPPARGFNLAAWILPGLGLVVGLAIVVLIVRRLRSRADTPAQPHPEEDVDPKLLEAIEEEMKKSGLEARG